MHGLSSKARGFVALGLVVLLVLGVTASVLVAYRQAHPTDKPYSLKNDGDPIPSAHDANAAAAVAQQFILRSANLDTSKVEDYVNGLADIMTTRFRGNPQETIASIKQCLGSKQQTSTGEIIKAGVSSQDRDSATVLVLYVKKLDPSPTPYLTGRAEVSLRKVKGKWLVDNAGSYGAGLLEGVCQ